MYLELMGKIFLIIGTLGISVSAILFFRFDIIKAGYETGYIKFKGKKIKDKKLKNTKIHNAKLNNLKLKNTDFNNSKFDNRSVKNKNPDISKSSRKFLSEENGGIKRNKENIENIENKENYENNENIKIIADKRRKQFDITYSVKVCNSDVSVWNI